MSHFNWTNAGLVKKGVRYLLPNISAYILTPGPGKHPSDVNGSFHVKKSALFKRVLIPGQSREHCVFCSLLTKSLFWILQISLVSVLVRGEQGFLSGRKTLCFADLSHFCLLPHKSFSCHAQKKRSHATQCISAVHLSSRWKTWCMWHWLWPGCGAGPTSDLPIFRRAVAVPVLFSLMCWKVGK